MLGREPVFLRGCCRRDRTAKSFEGLPWRGRIRRRLPMDVVALGPRNVRNRL